MARLYGEKENIDGKKVKSFFDKRAEKDVESLMTITSFQDKDILDKRELEEKKILLENIDFTNKKILEIGCGLGRWTEFFHDKCDTYLGIDYSKNLIEIAKENFNYKNCYFQEMSALDIDIEKLIVKPPFDMIFITGVIMYLNDNDAVKMIKEINNLVSDNKTIYIRESISLMDNRLTLKDFYSDELETDYNAIYRTKDELMEYFNKFENIQTIDYNRIYQKLSKHAETGYMYFILK